MNHPHAPQEQHEHHRHNHGHSNNHNPSHSHSHSHDHDQADILDLDADVLAGHLASLTARLPVEADPRRIVDLGCGTGAGTLALLERFPGAQVTAVDSSPAHLERLREKAAAAGVADRVRLVEADLDAAQWPALGTPELVWASASLHHMADPERTLRQVHELLAPGGLFTVVELAGFPRFLPVDAPESAPGLEERCHAALDGSNAGRLPHRGADWGPLLTRAGFTVEAERTLPVDIAADHDNAVGRYALSSLRRIRAGVSDVLSATDLAALDALLDTEGPQSVLRRGDVGVRTERTVWTARRDRPDSV
ncbi:class I SAM-dependent methyltransferase [Streptomyces sp. NPDC050085]|uniref:class I SAM-dependent methyltransferase n=1 Tax=Streptomyces sp. NPDC050085 TaxID=3365600 RepID=UPI003789CB17